MSRTFGAKKRTKTFSDGFRIFGKSSGRKSEPPIYVVHPLPDMPALALDKSTLFILTIAEIPMA